MCRHSVYIVRAYFELGTLLRLFIRWESQQFEIKIYLSSLISVAIVIGVLRALIKFSWKSIELGRRFSPLRAALRAINFLTRLMQYISRAVSFYTGTHKEKESQLE
jgi:hypothetical protein